jgi:hypothetical protein
LSPSRTRSGFDLGEAASGEVSCKRMMGTWLTLDDRLLGGGLDGARRCTGGTDKAPWTGVEGLDEERSFDGEKGFILRPAQAIAPRDFPSPT